VLTYKDGKEYTVNQPEAPASNTNRRRQHMSNTKRNTESNAAVTITEKERALLEGIRDSQYHDGQDPIEHATWTWDALDNSGLNPESRGGVASSLEKKGLAWFDQATTKAIGSGDDDTCAITAAGMAALLRHYEDAGINVNAIKGDAYVSVDRVDADGCFRAADYEDATTVISVRWDCVSGARSVANFDPADEDTEERLSMLFESLGVREVSTSSSVDHADEYGTDVDVAELLGRALSWTEHGAMARQAEAEEEAAAELAEHTANEARNIETAHRSRHGAGVYRVAHWGGDVYRVERQHTGRDGRTLSIGDYSAGEEHYGREELTKAEAESLTTALNNAVATVDGNALELALRRTTVEHARQDMADELAQQRAYDLGHHGALEACECNGLEALCEECGGTGRRPYQSTINGLEMERRNLDGYAADVELAKDTVLDALGRLEAATRRWVRADNRLTNLDDAIANARRQLEERS
jgi:hypothetical protein